MRDVVGSDGNWSRLPAVCAALCLVVAAVACGGEDDAAPATTPPAVSTTVAEEPPATTTATEPAATTTQPAPTTTEPTPTTTQPAPTTTEPAPTTTEWVPEEWLPPEEYTEYMLVTDEFGAVEVEVPVEWSSLNPRHPFIIDDEVRRGVGLRASPDWLKAEATWEWPGVWITAGRLYENNMMDRMLAVNVEKNSLAARCTPSPVEDYDDGLYLGYSQEFTGCGGTSAGVMLIAAADAAAGVKVLVTIQTVSPADDAARQRIIDTFEVVGAVDGDLVIAPEQYSGYREVVDDSGVLRVEVPNEWVHAVSATGFNSEQDGEIGVGMNVATDVDLWFESWGVPGLYFAATTRADFYDFDEFFFGDQADDDWFYLSECTRDGVYEYDDGLYTGYIGEYVDCGGGDRRMTIVLARPPDDTFMVLVVVTLVNPVDDEALDRIVASFEVIGDPPS